ncbi:MAG: response regulator transcription factor, partial [Chitinophagaceae bacterium]
MKYNIRLLIADDHEIFRDGLALMLARQKEISLLGQAGNGKELVELSAAENPDVIITDIKMPMMDGIQATREILKNQPGVKIIALSMFDEEMLIVDMLEAGAKGYLLKNADKTEILEAIETVFEDKTYYCHHTSARLTNMIVKS